MRTLTAYKPARNNIVSAWNIPFLENFFEDFYNPNLCDDFRKPVTNVVEKEKSYNFDIELAGFKESEINVKLEKDILTIKAEKSDIKEEKEKERNVISERSEKYYRSFVLPENADCEKIEAKFENGLLSLEVGKKEKTEPKIIEIK